MPEKPKRLPHAPIWCELVCRMCSRHIVGQFSSTRLPRGPLIRDARAKGARFAHGEVFCGAYCESHFDPQETAS